MAKVPVYNLNGEKVKDKEVSDNIFKLQVDPVLVHQLVVTITANQRQVLAHTKGRSEVAGGGKKPWKQKGTGRARHGSIRSPLWVGGGVTFGPSSNQNFAKKMNKKARTKALLMVLTDKLENQALIGIDKFELPAVKTKEVIKLLAKLPVKDKKTLIVLGEKNDKFIMAAKNLPQVKTVRINSLNVIDLLNYPYLLMSEKALDVLVKQYE